MRQIVLVALIETLMVLAVASSSFARVEDYGHRTYTRIGHGEWHGDRGDHVIDRRHGGWAGSLAAGLLGAAAGFALGSAVAPPVVVGPPAIGTMVPYLPGACVSVPNYYGGVLYNCGNIYYQPVYEGYSVMYQVVPAP